MEVCMVVDGHGVGAVVVGAGNKTGPYGPVLFMPSRGKGNAKGPLNLFFKTSFFVKCFLILYNAFAKDILKLFLA
jgi:hypothetical protein